jgi:TetR/AcrR family transcriptional regulator
VLDPGPALRLEDVARPVGASRATLYYYFSGRDDPLSFPLAEHTRPAAEAMRAAVRASDGAEARLRAMVRALAEYLTSHPGTCAGLLGALGAAGRLGEILQVSDTWIAAPLREVLTHGCDAGVLAAGNPADAGLPTTGYLFSRPARCGLATHRDTGHASYRSVKTGPVRPAHLALEHFATRATGERLDDFDSLGGADAAEPVVA